ncbi:MAG: glutamate--tRNA ligase [Phycisphaerae bacterium]|nr:glutamate--tRNA ligase [Phycisphaerae bacterium]
MSTLSPSVVTRFAPSPSGHLHVGGARTALFCWAFARGKNGRFVLRIEDTDQKRSSDAASIGFLNDMEWLNIGWDEGPEHGGHGGGTNGPYFQSERLDIYNRVLDQLVREGKAYYAFDTPAELDARRQAAKAAGAAYRYDRTAMASLPPETVAAYLKDGRPAVIRIKTPAGPITIKDEILGEATLPAGEVDDFVIRKADGFPTYHFAVVVDDEMMGVTHVLRAQEHFNNTAKHMVIQDALQYRRPVYAHLPIICNPDGSKMSKRDKDRVLRKTVLERKLAAPPAGTVSPERFAAWLADKNTQLDYDDATALAQALDVALPEINVDDFRRSGYLPQVLCNFLALNGWSPGENIEKFDNEFLKQRFDVKRVVKTPAKFDRLKLLSFNCDAITGMPREEFVRLARAHGERYHPEFMGKITPAQFQLLAEASHERSKTLDELFRANRFFLVADDVLVYERSKPIEKALLGAAPNGLDALRDLLPELQAMPEWTAAALEERIKAYAERALAGSLGKVAQPLRVAVSGGTVSPPIFDTLAILGKQSTVARVQRCVAQFAN